MRLKSHKGDLVGNTVSVHRITDSLTHLLTDMSDILNLMHRLKRKGYGQDQGHVITVYIIIIN